MNTQGAILLVEDNADDIELTLRAFRRNNIANELLIARDGQQALDLLAQTGSVSSVPALVLLDLNIPKVSGLEVLRSIRSHRRTKHVPVVVLSSSDMGKDIVESYGLGANSYIRKPVSFTKFIEVVSQLGLYWLVLNKPPPTAD